MRAFFVLACGATPNGVPLSQVGTRLHPQMVALHQLLSEAPDTSSLIY